ncbi:hypothetical protein NPIL_625581 [Nephila pilipes]|uniref:Uncharacterized protein n=1 Tax=Nephila pilipes TaxID=299642 RepID=A0A8X6PQY0_NEPPI|nr:hypothetical protein NPIL_625581 [Nephila pilipes]
MPRRTPIPCSNGTLGIQVSDRTDDLRQDLGVIRLGVIREIGNWCWDSLECLANNFVIVFGTHDYYSFPAPVVFKFYIRFVSFDISLRDVSAHLQKKCLRTVGCGPYRRPPRKISMCPGGILPYSIPQSAYSIRQVTTSPTISQDCLIPSHRATIFRQTGGQDAHRDTHKRHAFKW